MQSINSIEKYAYGYSKDLITEKEEIKCNNTINQCKKWLTLMMFQKKTNKHNPNWPEIADHPYRILIVGGSRSGCIT